MKIHVFVFAFVGVVAAPAIRAQQKTVVPAFFEVTQHTDPSKDYDWTRIANQGSAVMGAVAEDVFSNYNVSTDCSPVPTDCHNGVSNYTVCQAKCQFTANRAVGQLLLGYVDGNFGCNNLSGANTKDANWVNSTLVQKWKDRYGSSFSSNPYVQGIFVDDGPTLSLCGNGDLNGLQPNAEIDQKTNFETLYGDIHSAGGVVLLNASQFKNEWVMSDTGSPGKAADYAVTFEQSYNNWVHNYYADQNGGYPASWWSNANYAGKLAHVLYTDSSLPLTQYNVRSAVTASHGSPYYTPLLYLYDGTINGSSTSYDHLACFFEEEVDAMQGGSTVTGTTYCSGAGCVDLDGNTSDCGACGHICQLPANGQSTSCTSGTCGFTCAAGYTACGSICTSCQTDINNCGACGTVCGSPPANADPACHSGSCGFDCHTGYFACGASCLSNSNSDPLNCGSCNHQCPGTANGSPACSNGTCTFACNPGYILCNGSCVDESLDNNCGACGRTCPQSESCSYMGDGIYDCSCFGDQCP